MLMVVKIGGDLLKDGIPEGLVGEIGNLSNYHKIILVHGGGDIVTDIASQLGHSTRFVVSPKGFKSRYTDKKTIEIFMMVMAGKINKEIISTMQAKKVNVIGLSGLDGRVVQAKRKKQIIALNKNGRKILIDGDYTGKIENINTDLLKLLLDNGYIPVLSALAIGEDSEPLNVDGDRMAASIAIAMKADRLLLLTDVSGVYIDSKTIPKLSLHEANKLMEQIGVGMITKVYAATEAVTSDISEVIIGSGFIHNALTRMLNHSNGTVITK